MMESFCAWAADPARTGDQLYTAELLIEASEQLWAYRHREADDEWRERRSVVRHRRRIDAGYRAKLGRERFERAAEYWAEVTDLRNSCVDDPPVRNLDALQFCPQLKDISVTSELTDLTPLARLPLLVSLSLSDATLVDLAPLGELAALQSLSLRLEWPWPEGLAVLARMPTLKTIDYSGNLLLWVGVAELPAVETLQLGFSYRVSMPLRDLRGLPSMPRLRKFRGPTTALAGIERYPSLVELDLQGPFIDLGPLAGLLAVRKLELHGERFMDLAPVARMPELREFVLAREHGIDLDPLVEAPRLRRVSAPRCKVLATELATLNAALGLVDESKFARTVPRDRPALRLIACEFYGKRMRSLPPPPEDDEYASAERTRRELCEDDPLFAEAEARWFERELRARLGDMVTKESGRVSTYSGQVDLFLFREREAKLIREVVEALAEVMARARFHWKALISVSPPDEDELRIGESGSESSEDEFDVEQEREEWESGRRYQRERRELLESEHRQRLREQQGLAPEPAAEDAPELEAEETDDEDEAEEPIGPDLGWLDEDRSFAFFFDGAFVWLHPSYVENLSYYFSEAPENWDDLPGPPERRPRLR
jgi:hypothetical protein